MLFSSGQSDGRLSARVSGQRLAQASTRAVQAEADRRAIRPERDGDLVRRQALPCSEGEQLAVGFAQGCEGASERARILVRAGGVNRSRVDARDEPLAERGAPAVAAALVRDDAPRHAEQPRTQLVALRARVEAPPQRGEGLGDRLGGVVGMADPAERVAADRLVQLAIGRLESLAALGIEHRAILHNRNMSGSGQAFQGRTNAGPRPGLHLASELS
jgi:hypothetical protein